MRSRRRDLPDHRTVGTAALALALAAGGGQAQERAPAERQSLLDLAYALGQTHWVRTVCKGAEDQTWRARMARMLEVEKAEGAFRDRLVTRFNEGYSAQQAAHPDCDAGALAAGAVSARRGSEISSSLSRSS